MLSAVVGDAVPDTGASAGVGRRFVAWYNRGCKHSDSKKATPEQRLREEVAEFLRKRDHRCHQVRTRHPRRWSGKPRDWTLAPSVYLDSERPREDELKQAAKSGDTTSILNIAGNTTRLMRSGSMRSVRVCGVLIRRV